MEYNLQPRLKLYYTSLTKFDTIDKCYIVQLKSISKLSIVTTWNLTSYLTKNSLNSLVFKEFSTYKRFYYKKTIKNFHNSNFVATIRKIYIYFYLEFLINSYLLFTNLNFKFTFLGKGNSINSCSIFSQNKFLKINFQPIKVKNLFSFKLVKNNLNLNCLSWYFM